MNSRINEVFLYLDIYKKTSINELGIIICNHTENVKPKMLREVIYPYHKIIIKYQFEPTQTLLYEMTYKSKKGFFTLRDLINKVINFYSKPHSKSELDSINKLNEHYSKNIIKGYEKGRLRSYYLYSNIFKGLKKINEHVYEIKFANT